MAAKARPENLAAAESAGLQAQAEGEEPQEGAPAPAGFDMASIMGGAPPPQQPPIDWAAMTQGEPAPLPADGLAGALERQGKMFADALRDLGDKLTAPRVAIRDREGKIIGSKVEAS
ncbi:MAG: hypothetical protein ACOYOJ_19285, partial [Alsobacter sp.]